MLPMFWDETHHALTDAAQGWVAEHLAPHVEEWEEAGTFPLELYVAAGQAGLLGVTSPVELGGGGGDVFHALIVAEALIRSGSVGLAMGLGSASISLPPILALGTAEQQARFAAPVIAGSAVACLGITEPGAGSDVAGLRSRARRDGGDWILDGEKTFITSATRADVIVLLARTSDDRHGGLTFFVLEKGMPGLSAGRPMRKMGWWASDTASLHLDNVRVPDSHRLGPVGSGFVALMRNFTNERLLLAGSAVAVSRLAIEHCEQWMSDRQAFGRPLHGFQALRHRMADMQTDEAAARAFVSVVAERRRQGQSADADSAMAKNMAAAACARVTDGAIQLHGGMGFMRECAVERLYRDQRLFSIGGGTSEVLRELIRRR